MFKLVIKINFISSNFVVLLIINVKILSNFQMEWCTFGRKKKFQSLSVFNMQKHFWLVSSFKNVNFAVNGKYSKTNYDNPNYYVSFVIFQTYKNIIKKSVHSLEWFLLLCFYLFVKHNVCNLDFFLDLFGHMHEGLHHHNHIRLFKHHYILTSTRDLFLVFGKTFNVSFN